MPRGLELTILQDSFRNKQQNFEETVLTYAILFPSFGETKESYFPAGSGKSVLQFGLTSTGTEGCSFWTEPAYPWVYQNTDFVLLVYRLDCPVHDITQPDVSQPLQESLATGGERS